MYGNPLALLPLQASGGSGQYTFSLTESASGAILNPATGAVLPGTAAFEADPDADVGVDLINVSDNNCDGDLEITLRVVPDMEVRPRRATLRPGQVLTPEVLQGSGRLNSR